ncbi:MAG TPA: hypothetical protein VFT00_06655 [Nocardioides sp.]|nr:hypothetical protein [Nocardioides sp.]
MTDDPDLTPEQETRVRRLLTDARHAEPIPEDVAARLDRVLAQLAVDDTDDTGRVVSLAARRRRRAGSLLVAAAAVVVVGIGLGQLLGPPNSGSDSSPASTDAGSTMREAPEGADAGTLPAPTYALKSPVPIHPDRFSRDVTRIRRLASTVSGAQELGPTTTDDKSAFACSPAAWGAGTFVPVTYGGDPAVLVLRRVTGDTQVVELFECGSSEPLRSITLPAP